MSYLEVFYNPSSNDWDAVSDAALKRISYTPDVILCYRRSPATNMEVAVSTPTMWWGR